jgi:hypothetical protein
LVKKVCQTWGKGGNVWKSVEFGSLGERWGEGIIGRYIQLDFGGKKLG